MFLNLVNIYGMAIANDLIINALSKLYASGDPSANEFLVKIQQSEEAWEFCWDFLDQPSIEAQYFGASTIYVKVCQGSSMLTGEKLSSFRKRLLDRIIQCVLTDKKLIVDKLLSALVCLLLHSLTTEWPNGLSELVTHLQKIDSETHPRQQNLFSRLILQLFSQIPDEYHVMHITVKDRKALSSELQSQSNDILSLCSSALTNHLLSSAAIECIGRWVTLRIAPDVLFSHISGIFQFVRKPETTDSAMETLINFTQHPDITRYPKTMLNFLVHLVQLGDLLHTSLSESDLASAHSLSLLFCSFGETSSSFLLDLLYKSNSDEQRQLVAAFLQIMLLCTSIPGQFPVDEDFSDLSFSFCFCLQDDMLASEPQIFAILLESLQPYYARLLEIFLVKCRYPELTEYNSWNSDEKEKFRCYRQDVSDTLMYCYNVLRGDMLQMLGTTLEKVASDAMWQSSEAVLFMIGSVSSNVEYDESVYMGRIFALLPRIRHNHTLVTAAALETIGNFSEWINFHAELLGPLLGLVLQCVNNPDLAQAASMALRELTQSNKDHIRPLAEDILKTTFQAISTTALRPRDKLRLMSCIGQTLSVCPTRDIIAKSELVLSEIVTKLKEISDTIHAEAANELLKQNVHFYIELLSWFFSGLCVDDESLDGGPHPVILVLEPILPVLHSVALKFAGDEDIVQGICDIIKRSMTNSLNHFDKLYPVCAHMLADLFQQHPYCGILEISKLLLLTFARDESLRATNQSLFREVSMKTLSLLPNQILDHPDLLEYYLMLLSQLFKKNMHVLVVDQSCLDLGQLFELGLLALGRPESLVVKHGCLFLSSFIANKTSSSEQLVLQYLPRLLEILIDNVSGRSSRSLIDHFSEVFLALNKHYTEQIAQCLTAMMGREGYPNDKVSAADKQLFVTSVLRQRINVRKLREIVIEFSEKCHGIYGTKYASETQKLTDFVQNFFDSQ